MILGLTGYAAPNKPGLTDQALAGLLRRTVERIDVNETAMTISLITGATIRRPVPGLLAPSPRGAAAKEIWRQKGKRTDRVHEVENPSAP